jgi:hypothetical protein
VVYRGWVLGNMPWAVRTRRRLYWQGMRAGMPYAWVIPGSIPAGIGLIAWAVSAHLLGADPGNRNAVLLAFAGFPLIFVPILLSWRQVDWFLAPWHRTEIGREEAGLQPLLPPPAEGAEMRITRREMLIGLALATACLVLTWATQSSRSSPGPSVSWVSWGRCD